MIPRILFSALTSLVFWSLGAFADPLSTQRLETTWRNATDLDGEVVELATDEGPFVAIHRVHARGPGRGTFVLLHGRGTNANSLDVVRPLRLGLADAGWDTLSLQLPGVYAGAEPDAWAANAQRISGRLQAALDWLKQNDRLNQAVGALGDSAPIALRYAARQAPKELKALVLIGGSGDEADKEAVDKLGIPLLDLVAERDLRTVRDAADARRRIAREAGLDAYRQRLVPDANGLFRGHEGQLVSIVRAWLNTHADGTELGRKP